MKHETVFPARIHCASYWWIVAVGVLSGSTALAQERRPGEIFRDCPDCPEIVVIQSGTFLMGCLSPYGWRCELIDALPVHEVRILQPFGIGKYEVTVAQWDACVSSGGCNGYRPEDPGFHRGSIQDSSPVVNVNWDDAQAYVRWLSEVSGATYRLPSEAEWEYAARAETTTVFPWGDEIGEGWANCEADDCGENWRNTAPVGSFPPNPFGVYDMHGNVYEWVEDCWNDSYVGAPSDGSAWLSGDCTRSVWRSGSWYSSRGNIQSARRLGTPTGNRNNRIGFRVARTLDP